MNAAEAKSRKGRKAGVSADRLALAAKLGALEKNLGVPVKRHRDPGAPGDVSPDGKKETKQQKDVSITFMKNF